MFNRISEQNFKKISLPRESSLVNYSVFNELSTDLLFRSFSIKLVLDGCESYNIDGHTYKISKGEYLLANSQAGGKLTIGSNSPVKGLCIDIAPKIMTEAVSGLLYPSHTSNESNPDDFFTSANYPENKYIINNGCLGSYLQQISSRVLANTTHGFEFSNEFYYRLAEAIVAEQYQIYPQINNIRSVKLQTRKELLRKLLTAKKFMDSDFASIKSVEEVAIVSNMSEYHFSRLFRQVFKTSPHQYLIHKKLELAHLLLKEKQRLNITDIAIAVGFNDLPTFSKRFKKEFGVSPVAYHTNGESK